MDNSVFIQTNDKQYIGALVAEYSIKRNSRHGDKINVRIMNEKDYPFFRARQGQLYLRQGSRRKWVVNDLQSFTLTRFLPPELTGYQGRAVVIDPDVFAVGDIWGLLTKDMEGHAILCRPRSGSKGAQGCHATSVMLLDCAKLTHWKCEKQFDQMFEFQLDYHDWICLNLEPPDSIGEFATYWNDFDNLTETTKLLHNTKRQTQPWKTGLPIDFRPREKLRLFPPKGWIKRAKRTLFGEYAMLGKYRPHPDPAQEHFFFGLLRECLDQGIVSEELLRKEMRQNHVRHDAFEVLERTPTLSAA
ncbi:MAG: hypothetical protein V3S33_06950 [Gammaproteobacteria bacterium]